MKRQWTKEEAWDWYNKKGWLRGCNFISSDCCNRIDMWQSYGRDARMRVVEQELKLCMETGFNSIRLLVEFDVWYQEHDQFMEILEQYITLAYKYGQSVMLCLANNGVPCFEDNYVPKKLGKQEYAWGYHQGRAPIMKEDIKNPPRHALEYPETRDAFLQMVHEIVGKYAKDDRIIFWNVYNEPSCHIGERSLPLIDMLFEAVRSEDPIQPLGSDVCDKLDENNLVQMRVIELSDVISYHCYRRYAEFLVLLEEVQAYGRPIMVTEWLNRLLHSNVEELYPYFYKDKIDCYCWGFVLGKTQTNEPWTGMWENYVNTPIRPTPPCFSCGVDFSKWMHDLYRPNHMPYIPNEIAFIKYYNKLADKREGVETRVSDTTAFSEFYDENTALHFTF